MDADYDDHQPPEGFRADALAAVDWVAEYLSTVAERPVASRVVPGEIRARIPTKPPEHGEPLGQILEYVTQDLLPGITHWNHPRFLAYVPQGASTAAIVADTLAAALNVNGLLWQTSPALTELEGAVLDWIAQLLGLPGSWFGQLQESASLAALTSLTVARDRARRAERDYHTRIVCSDQTHASVQKVAHVLDLPLTLTRADRLGRMSLSALQRELEHGDVCAVVATIGTTSTAAVDPLAEIAALCREHGAWLHVDGAYVAASAICAEYAHILDGVEFADSFVINAHKWLGVTAPCTCLFTAHRADFRASFATSPAYLEKDEEVINLVDYGPMFSRRFSALKLWMRIRSVGAAGLRREIRARVALACEFANLVESDPAWELVSQSFGVVCFRVRGSDEMNARLVDAVNRDGRIFISRTRVGGEAVLRVAIGNAASDREDVRLAWDVLREHAAGRVAIDA